MATHHFFVHVHMQLQCTYMYVGMRLVTSMYSLDCRLHVHVAVDIRAHVHVEYLST